MADLLITTQDSLPGPDGEAPYVLFVDATPMASALARSW